MDNHWYVHNDIPVQSMIVIHWRRLASVVSEGITGRRGALPASRGRENHTDLLVSEWLENNTHLMVENIMLILFPVIWWA